VARTPGTGGVWAVDYFRVYHDVIDNPKIACLPPETCRFLLFVWCIASRQPARDGVLPSATEIAFRARCSVAEAEGQLAALVSARLVTKSGGVFSVAKWNDFQPAGATNAERQRRHRQRKRNPQSEESAQSDPCNVTRNVTVTGRDVTRNVTRNEIIEREKPPTESSSSSAAHPKTNPPSSANPPHPPRGAARGVGGLDDDEPFAAPPEPAVDLDPVTLPPEVADVERLADELFPSGGMSTSARRACLSGVKPAWVAEALRVARDAGASRWAYVARILVRWAEAGVSDAERGKARADPAPFTGRHKVPLSERIKRAEAAEARRRAEDQAREGRHDGGTGGGLVPEVR
jgi:hypothetical protein